MRSAWPSWEVPRRRWRLTFRVSFLRWIFVGFLVSRALVALVPSTTTAPSLTSLQSQIGTTSANDPATARARDEIVADAFGPGKTMVWLSSRQPEVGDAIGNWVSRYGPSDPAEADAHALGEINTRALAAASAEGGKSLDSAMRLRAAMLTEAVRMHGCDMFLMTGTLPAGADLGDAMQRRQWALNTRLAEVGVLVSPPHLPPAKASVPGAIIAQVMTATGFDRDRVATAMRGLKQNDDRCTVAAALIHATLASHVPQREAILRVLQ